MKDINPTLRNAKSLSKQAMLRKLKTPDVLAEQSALNSVMLGRKPGMHKRLDKAGKLSQVKIKEALSE